MPELTCALRIGPAISEPVQLADGRILLAAETPARDAIHVYTLNDPLPRRELSARVLAIQVATLPGGPTDNGTRAMWPRVSQWMAAGDGVAAIAYQRGPNCVLVGTDAPVFLDRGLAMGVWPVGVEDGATFTAPPTTSQGVFGYLDGRWWTYDEMRESGYQQDWLRLGTLSHAWSSGSGDNFLYKHESGTVLRWNNARWRVFSGQAEYPRGCTLQDGRILVTAVGPRVREVSPGVWEHQLRVAVSPFDKFESEEPMATRIRVLEWGPGEGLVAPAHTSAVVEIDGSSRYFKHIRPVGQADWITEERATTNLALEHFYVRDPGAYEFRFSLASGVETSIRRFTVLAPPAPESPPVTPPQVITDDNLDTLDQLQGALAAAIWKTINYTNARCAGQSHDEALQTYREAVIAAIRGGS